jgi:hypothetical protein
MHFLLEPPGGVGPVRIGLTRDQARDALDSLKDPSDVSDSDRPGLNVFRPSGLMVSVDYGADGLVNAVELGRPQDGDTVLFQDVDVFALPARQVVTRMRQFTTLLEEDGGGSFVAPDLLLAFWRPFVADDEPAEPQGYYFSSVLLARPGYYDGPA